MAVLRTIQAGARQTMNDIAIMYYGTIEAVAGICFKNGFDISYQPVAGQSIVLPDTMPDGTPMPVNVRVLEYYTDNKLVNDPDDKNARPPANNYINNFFNNTTPWLWPDGTPMLLGGSESGWWLHTE